MKTIHLFVLTCLTMLACHSATNNKEPKVAFGIYEILKINEIPVSLLDSIQARGIGAEKDITTSVIGYIPAGDSGSLTQELSTEAFRLITTSYTVDDGGHTRALVAVKPNPVIQNSDLKKTRGNGNKVEIFFTLEGSRKWADLTRKSIGNRVAFVIDDLIYTMPLVQAEIRNGAAQINGFKDERQAEQMAVSLNKGID